MADASKACVTARIVVDGRTQDFSVGETSESRTYPFNEVCDRKQPLTMKGDTFYAKVVNMLEAAKVQTNDFLTKHMEAAKAGAKANAAAAAGSGGGAAAGSGGTGGAAVPSTDEGPPEDKRARRSGE